MSESLYPLLFKPVYKDYLWGGRRILDYYKRDEPDGIYAESWEVSERPEGMSVIENGPLAGQTLADAVKTHGANLLGNNISADQFPLLIKLIDSKQKLSVQVHPNDETAARFGGEAKTEMWYVLAAEDDAYVYAGLQPGVDEKTFVAAIENNTFEDVLVKIPVRPGDAVFMRGGRVHAIGEGCLLLECQQNSNTTYRIYDWGRVGADGNPRELHIDEALNVILWDDTENALVTPVPFGAQGGSKHWEVLKTDYFAMERIDLKDTWKDLCDGSSFHILFTARGECTLEAGPCSMLLPPGTSCMLPANTGPYTLKTSGRSAEVIKITA